MEIQHIGRDADNLRDLLDDEVLGRIAMVVLDRIEIGRIDGTPVFASQLRGKFPLRYSRLLAGFSEHLTESLHSSPSAPATAARRLELKSS